MQNTIGIDISKSTLDVFWLDGLQHRVFANDLDGLKHFSEWLVQTKSSLVIFEATGVYGRLLEGWLAQKAIPFHRINPKQARRFAEGIGKMAKTDKVDAALLAKMGALLDVEPQQPQCQTQHNLKELSTARRALLKDRTAAKARLETAALGLLKAQINRRLKQIKRDLADVENAIDTILQADGVLSERAEILGSIPGIARVTACALLTDMPELGQLSGKQAASFAGLAPISRQSGKWQVREHIRGGRASLRRSLYLPAIVATRFNPDMKAKYAQLVASGKCKKLAITAIMRKLLVLANALIRDRRKWNPEKT